MQFLEVIVAEGVDLPWKREAFQGRIGWEDEYPGLIADCGDFGDEDVGRPALPTLLLVKGPVGLLEPHLLHKLIGALRQRPGVLRRPNGAGRDRAVRAGILGGQGRRDEEQGQENRNGKTMRLGHEPRTL